jgi:predicted ATPase
MFADAASHGHQLLVTTHSESFMQALSELQQSGHLSPEQVAVYRFSKSSSGAKAEHVLPEVRSQKFSTAG